MFSGILQKNDIKTSDFRDLLLEGAIFIVVSQNLPQVFWQRCLWLSNILC